MKLIIEEKGNNSWVTYGIPYCKVGNDFADTQYGVTPNYGNVLRM
jgi:hypothetical protein